MRPNLSIIHAEGIGDKIVPTFITDTIHELWSAVMGMGESALSRIGIDGEFHPNEPPTDSISIEALWIWKEN